MIADGVDADRNKTWGRVVGTRAVFAAADAASSGILSDEAFRKLYPDLTTHPAVTVTAKEMHLTFT